MKYNTKPTETANLCSMNFLKVLKSRIKKTDKKVSKFNSSQSMRGLANLNAKFKPVAG
jgi:hypothetical protein